jgi:hypothetical protein
MKVQHSIDREIEVVEHLIDQLNQCVSIFIHTKNFTEIKNTKHDIQKCKVELKRLYDIKHAEKNDLGETNDAFF